MLQNVGQVSLNPWQVFYLLITQYSWVFILFAVFSWIMAQRMMRSISILVAYHRRGVAVEIYKGKIQGQSLSFFPRKGVIFAKKSPIDIVRVTIDADPEMQIQGLRTYSLHHIIEGYTKTVNIRQIPVLLARLYQASAGIPLTTGTSGSTVATSLATMQNAFTSMGGSFAKTKGEYMINFVWAAAGMGWGIVMGYFVFKGKVA